MNLFGLLDSKDLNEIFEDCFVKSYEKLVQLKKSFKGYKIIG
jgi:hypothetical protein